MEAETQEYRGHRIEIRIPEADKPRAREDEDEHEAKPELLIDHEPVPYGQLPGGLYALHEYAYDWQTDLMDLAKRFIDYRNQADEIRRESGEKT